MSITVRVLLFVFMLFLISLSAFFSASETAYTSLSKLELQNEINKKSKVGILIKKQISNYSMTISTILLGNNIVNIGLATLFSFWLSSWFLPVDAAIIGTFTLTPFLVIFGEIIPKLIAKKYPLGYLKKVAITMVFFYYFFFPFTFMLRRLVKSSQVTISEEELHSLIVVANEEKVLGDDKAWLAKKALEFNKQKISKVMIDIKKITYINYDDSIEVVKETFIKSGYSRLPIKKNDHFIGYVYAKHFLNTNGKTLKDFILDYYSISKDAFLNEGLQLFKKTRSHLLLVRKNNNVNAKIIGMLTIEDIIEDILGEIYDETDYKPPIEQISMTRATVPLKTKMIEITNFFDDIEFGIKKLSLKKMSLKNWLVHELKVKKLKTGATLVYKDKIRFEIAKDKKNKIFVKIKLILK